MAARDEAQADVEVDTLIVSARRLRWRAPELALVLSERAAALAAARRDEPEQLRAEASAVSALNRLGRGTQVIDRAVGVLRAAETAGEAEVGWELRVELAANAKAARVPMTGFALLRPVLAAEAVPNALRATALVRATECLVGLGRSQPISDALDEADRCYAAAEEVDRDTRLLLRGQLHAVVAAHQRRWGELAGALAAARTGLALLDQVRDRDTDSGEVRGRLLLELVCALMDADELGEAARVAEPMLDRPVRAPFAASAGWLRLALATRVHLPAGRLEVAQALLRETVDSATRHQQDDLLAEALIALAHVHETRGELSDALAHLRSAHAAERRQARTMFGVRARLAEGFIADGRESGMPVPDQLAALVRPYRADQRRGTVPAPPGATPADVPVPTEPAEPPWSAEPEMSADLAETHPAAIDEPGETFADEPDAETAGSVAEWSWTAAEAGDLPDSEKPPVAPRRTSSLRRIGQGQRGDGRRRSGQPIEERGEGLSAAWAQAADRWRLHQVPGPSPAANSAGGEGTACLDEAADLAELGRIAAAGGRQATPADETVDQPAADTADAASDGRRRAEDRPPRHGADRPTGLDVLTAAGVTPIPGTGGRRRAADPDGEPAADASTRAADTSSAGDRAGRPTAGPQPPGTVQEPSALLPEPDFHPLSAPAAELGDPYSPVPKTRAAGAETSHGASSAVDQGPVPNVEASGRVDAPGDRARRSAPRYIPPADPEPAMWWYPDAALVPSFVADPRRPATADGGAQDQGADRPDRRPAESRIPEPPGPPDLPDPERPEPEREPAKQPPLPDPMPAEPGPDAIPPARDPDARPAGPKPDAVLPVAEPDAQPSEPQPLYQPDHDRQPRTETEPAAAGEYPAEPDPGAGSAPADGPEPVRVSRPAGSDQRGGFVGLVELPAKRGPAAGSGDAGEAEPGVARVTRRPRRKGSFRFGDPESRESRRRVNAALAELLAEALVAYETGRRGEAEPEPSPPEAGQPDSGGSDDLAAGGGDRGYPDAGYSITGAAEHPPADDPVGRPRHADDQHADDWAADNSAEDDWVAEKWAAEQWAADAGSRPSGPLPDAQPLDAGIEPAVPSGADDRDPTGYRLTGDKPQNLGDDSGYPAVGYGATSDDLIGPDPDGYGGSAFDPDGDAGTGDQPADGGAEGTEPAEPAETGRAVAGTERGGPPAGGRSRRGGAGTLSVADLLQGLGVDVTRASRGRASRSARRRSVDGGAEQEAPAGRHATGRAGDPEPASSGQGVVPGRHSSGYLGGGALDAARGAEPDDQPGRDAGDATQPDRCGGGDATEPDRCGGPRRLTAVSGGRPWEEDTGPIRFGFPEDDSELSGTEEYALDQYSVTAGETSFADWSRPATGQPPAAPATGQGIGGWASTSPGLVGHVGDDHAWGPGDAGYPRL